MDTDIADVSQLELKLLNALQLFPRISWSDLAPILHASPSTLSRKWKTLSAQGRAWVTARPGIKQDWYYFAPSGSTAYIEVACKPGTREAVIAALQGDPRVWTIECSSGWRDLLLSVTLESPLALDRFTSESLGQIPGITSVRTSPVRRFLATPSEWRLTALESVQSNAILALKEQSLRDDSQLSPTFLERLVFSELMRDGRASASDIAAAIDYSTSAVNVAIQRISSSGYSTYRLDFSQLLPTSDLMASFWIQAPQAQLVDIGATLRMYPTIVREAVSIVGASNLYVHVWAKSYEELDFVEEKLGAKFPALTVVDRWLTTRFAKRAGHLLDRDGLRSGFITPAGFAT